MWMILFNSIFNTMGGTRLTWVIYHFLTQLNTRFGFNPVSVKQIHDFGTFIAQVVPAASSVAGRTRWTWPSVFIRSVTPPVPPEHHYNTISATTLNTCAFLTIRRPALMMRMKWNLIRWQIHASVRPTWACLLTVVSNYTRDTRLWPRSFPRRSCCNTRWWRSRFYCWWPKPTANRRMFGHMTSNMKSYTLAVMFCLMFCQLLQHLWTEPIHVEWTWMTSTCVKIICSLARVLNIMNGWMFEIMFCCADGM